MDITALIRPYSPWCFPETRPAWESSIPTFRRPVFDQLMEDMRTIKQVLSITGPRRVGKSTLLRQMIRHLLEIDKIPPERIIYYSLDDPARLRTPRDGDDVLDRLVSHLSALGRTGPAYLFLDEIQTLDRWEQYLKKYYDLNHPVRMVISGSASSPIFKKSRESLLGRIKDYHVLPFSFREYLLYQLHLLPRGDVLLQDLAPTQCEEMAEPLRQEISELHLAGTYFRGTAVDDPQYRALETTGLPALSDVLRDEAQLALERYLVEGGFPEVWALPTQEQKIDYLYDNQIKKVIYEDLVLAAEFRKPEQLKAFYISLLEQPGREVTLKSLSQEAGVNAQQVEKYLPLLEMTDLLAHVSKFRSSPVRVRRGNMKFYLIDLALRNAVLRIGSDLLTDNAMLGLYAENLVFNALHRWKGVLQIDYYRDSNGREVDFIVHTRPSCYLPIEVKYRNSLSGETFAGMKYFVERHKCHVPTVVTKQDFGFREGFRLLPLVSFLLMMD